MVRTFAISALDQRGFEGGLLMSRSLSCQALAGYRPVPVHDLAGLVCGKSVVSVPMAGFGLIR